MNQNQGKKWEKLEKNLSEEKYEDGLFHEAGAFWLG